MRRHGVYFGWVAHREVSPLMSVSFVSAHRFVTRALELEKQVTTQTKRIEELEEMGTEAKREAAA